MTTSSEYPECPGCKRVPYPRITYPTFDHQTGKTYYKCHSARAVQMDPFCDDVPSDGLRVVRTARPVLEQPVKGPERDSGAEEVPLRLEVLPEAELQTPQDLGDLLTVKTVPALRR